MPSVSAALAAAIHIDQQICSGEVKDYADAARLRALTRERVSQLVRLNFLAPDIQVEILYLPPTPKAVLGGTLSRREYLETTHGGDRLSSLGQAA